MTSVTIIEKPDSVSYDEIASVLHDAHKSNIEKGMHFSAAAQSGDEIRKHLHGSGRFYIAAIGNAVVGVGAVRFRQIDKWFHQGYCADIVSVGIRSAYKGQGISKLLFSKLEQEAFKECGIVIMNTAEHNEIMLSSRLHDGWCFVDYLSHKGTDFYSIMLAKWKNGCPFSQTHCTRMFAFRKTRMKLVRDINGKDRLFIKAIKKLVPIRKD